MRATTGSQSGRLPRSSSSGTTGPSWAYKVDPLEVRALVEVRIWDGLRLFSGRARKIKAEGVEWDRAGEATETKMEVTKVDFVPKMDSYYMTLFIMAMRLLKGDRYLSI